MTTITIDKDLCTRCGTCSVVCPVGIIRPAGAETFPAVDEDKASWCIECGHCEVTCPEQALLLDFHPDEKVTLPAGAGTISPEELGMYLKKRRSVRHFRQTPVPREKIERLLDIARYAASGGNRQPVHWLIVYDPREVRRLAALTIDWVKSMEHTDSPMSRYIPSILSAWEKGYDPICNGAPHLVIAHIPGDDPETVTDAIIALTHFDIAAPSCGVGTCWAGFLSAAAGTYEPLQRAMSIPPGRKFAYGLMFGHPKFKVHGIPRRNPVQVTWQEG